MEPNNQNSNDQKKPLPPQDRPTYEDFHAEGIDIVTDSGVAESNEFTMGETNSAAEDALNDMERQKAAAESVPQKPLTPEQATRISNLQEIPRAEIAVPKKPQPTVAPQTPSQPRIASLIPTQTIPEQPKAPQVKNDPSIKQLRTFKSDAEEAVRYQNVSAIDIAVAEQKKREASTPIEYVHDESSHARLGIFIIIVLILIVALLGGWYYWFITSQEGAADARPAQARIESIIQYSSFSGLSIDPQEDVLARVAESLRSSKGIRNTSHMLVLKTGGVPAEPMPIADVMRDTDIPEVLLRSLANEYMIGAFMSSSTDPFILLKNNSFPNAFSGALKWESEIVRDLLPLIQIRHGVETGGGTTTKIFTDGVIRNTDVRLVKDELGETILVYAFVNKDTIAITTSEETLNYIIGELLKVRTIQ